MQVENVIGRVSDLLHASTTLIAGWLYSVLPELDKNWWKSLVLPKLSYQQIERVKRHGIDNLSQLDLSALLRVLDQNWYHISQRKNFSFQDRNYVKEMQTIRNQWAHITANEFIADDVYRDIDTIQRFLILFNASSELVSKAAEFKNSIMAQKDKFPTSKENKKPDSIEANNESKENNEKIKVGSIVSLKSNPNIRGAVTEISGTGNDCRCTVFIDGNTQQFYLSQLKVVDKKGIKNVVTLKGLHSLLTTLQLKHPSISTLYSLNAARIEFIPYQYRPALKIINSDQPRLLIADGVGVGKTIEAGLVLRELQARFNTESVLIICPKPLVAERKWLLEMKRFDERFTQIDGKTLNYCLDETDLEGEWPDQHKKSILPYSLFNETLLFGNSSGRRRRIGLLDLDPPPQFDLVIVDEAHHIRNAPTFTHQAVRFFCENSQAVIFLTATPIQLGNQDLYTLLNVLRPDIIIDQDSFNHMVEPNPFINEALRQARTGVEDWQNQAFMALNDAANTAWGNSVLRPDPMFQEVCINLEKGSLSRENRISLIRDIESFHSLSRIINRTRRRDIDDFCIRRSETIEVDFTDEQRQLHDDLLNFEATALSALHNNQNVRFMMSTIRRQTASCIFGLAPFISDILNRRLTELEWSETADYEAPDDNLFETLFNDAVEILDRANNLPSNDPKFEALWEIVSDKLELDNNKLMIFSSFRHTLSYLEEKLIEKNVRVGLIHGDINDDERLTLKQRFEKGKGSFDTIDIMLFSEVGCEGLDYQFCDAMINYDLTWNPMRIEQRIGRIDRKGQKSDVVVIYNFITPGTVDADIYFRCLDRIGIFEQSIGDCEEILGELHREIREIAIDLKMTEADRLQKLQQMADNEIRKIQEQRVLEDREHELFGINVSSLQADDDIRKSESFWLTSLSIYRFVTRYLENRIGKGEYILGEKDLKTLRLSQDARNQLLSDFRKLPKRTSPMFRSWEKYLKGTKQHCQITFDSAGASDNRDAHFIMPLHPLTRQAASYFEIEEPVYTALRISDQDIPSGNYPFTIYAWEYVGIKKELSLKPICMSEVVTANFIEYIESGASIDAKAILPDDNTFNDLDNLHHKQWSKEKEKHLEQTKKVCKYRNESMTTSHQGRLNVVDDQISNATNDKIHRMKISQRNNIIAEFERKKVELDEAEQSADIYARPVVFGVLKVEN